MANLTVLNPTLFEDKCDSSAGLTNYTTLLTIETGGTSALLEYDSTMNAYKVTSKSSGTKIFPIPVLKGKTDFTLTADVYITSDTITGTSLGFGVAVDESDGKYSEVGFALVRGENNILGHLFKDGSFVSNMTLGKHENDKWYTIKTVFQGTATTTTITDASGNVIVDSSTYDLTGISSTFSNTDNLQYGIDIAWSNGSYGYIRNIKAVQL